MTRFLPGWLITTLIVIVVIILAIVISALGGFQLDIGHFHMGVTK